MLGAAPPHRAAWLTLGIGGGSTLVGGVIGALSSPSNSIMLSGLDSAVHGVVGATIGFAVGMVVALAVYFGSKDSR